MEWGIGGVGGERKAMDGVQAHVVSGVCGASTISHVGAEGGRGSVEEQGAPVWFLTSPDITCGPLC